MLTGASRYRLAARVVLAVGDVDRVKLEDIAKRTRMKVVTVQRIGEATAEEVTELTVAGKTSPTLSRM